LVNGPVDLKITMWDADTGGSQVGSTNTFNAMQLNDGRFACGLNFGNAAFDGSNRWIQVEFRNPAGSGQYQALSPRDKITATPYALFALNGANGVWVYDTNQQSVSVIGKKIGIGTSNPTAALEVVSATGGDDSVKLPAGSIGVTELSPAAKSLGFGINIPLPPGGNEVRSFDTVEPCCLILNLAGRLPRTSVSDSIVLQVEVDGAVIPHVGIGDYGGNWIAGFGTACVPLAPGSHSVRLIATSTAPWGGGLVQLTAFTVQGNLLP
jgi:hypothetical protein